MHVALLCLPFFSHLRVFEAIGEELARRGHRVTLLLNAGAGGEAAAVPGIDVLEVPGREDGIGRAGRAIRGAGRAGGPFGLLRTVAQTAALTEELCLGAPEILARTGAEAIVGDEAEPAAGLLAAHLGVPHVSVSCGLPVDPDPAVPLPYLDWDYDPSERGLKRNHGGVRVARLLLTRQRRVVAAAAARLGLDDRPDAAGWVSRRLRLSQTVPAFDFPHPRGSPLRGVGPIRRRAVAGTRAPAVPDLPRGKPVVFASLGTLQGHRAAILRTVAAACRRIGATSVVAHCGRLSERQAAGLGADLVSDFFPQGAILARADACVTHGGLNTALDALVAATPPLVVPIAFDQPGVAARIVHHGAGLRLSRVLLSTRAVATSLERLIDDPSFREKASRIGREIEAGGGREMAVDLIEEAVSSRSAVLSGAAL